MDILFTKANKLIKKLIKEHLSAQNIAINKNKIIVPRFEVPYNKGREIEGTMTDRELLLQISKDVTGIKKDVVVIKQDIVDIKADVNNIVKKNNLKR